MINTLSSLPPFQAAKYDSRSKINRTRSQLKAANKRLAGLGIQPGEDKAAAFGGVYFVWV